MLTPRKTYCNVQGQGMAFKSQRPGMPDAFLEKPLVFRHGELSPLLLPHKMDLGINHLCVYLPPIFTLRRLMSCVLYEVVARLYRKIFS